MIKVFFGNDTVKVRAAALSFLSGYQEEIGAELVSVDVDSYAPGIVGDCLGSVSLFGDRKVYWFDTPSGDDEFNEAVQNALSEMASSEDVFVITEGTLLAPEKKPFTKYADQMQEFKKGETERFNTFALADALSGKDKKSLWLLFNEARLRGIAPEEIIGVLWWQLKTLRLSSLTANASEAGLKDYPYNKAKRALSKFKEDELEQLSLSLHKLQHESRLGLCDLEVALERWILSL